MSAESVEGHGGYTLKGRGDILEKLNLMLKKKSLLSAQPKGSSASFVTTVVKVLPDKGLVALDISENPSINQRFLAADETVLSARVDGIQARFTVGAIREATLNGQTVFAAALPESLFWLQQRKFFRVTIPLSLTSKCVINDPGMALELGVIDLSISGLALFDKHTLIGAEIEAGHRFQRCSLILPELAELTLGLEVRNKVPLTHGNPPPGQRVGCQFHDLTRQGEIAIQKFIYEIEMQKKRQEQLIKG